MVIRLTSMKNEMRMAPGDLRGKRQAFPDWVIVEMIPWFQLHATLEKQIIGEGFIFVVAGGRWSVRKGRICDASNIRKCIE